MKVPLTIRDFLDRAELVYGDRVAVVDEPDQPAPSLGSVTYRRARGAGPGPGRRPRPARRRARASGWRSCRRTRPACSTGFFGVSRLGPGARADQLPPGPPRRSPTSSSTAGRRCCSSTPSWRAPSPTSTAPTASRSATEADVLARRDVEPAAVGARRGRHRHHQLHERHHGPTQGRAADPPQPVAQRRHLRLAGRRQRPRRVPAHAADVPLQRLGHALRHHRHGRHARSCCARSTAPRSCAGSTSTASRCCAARRRSSSMILDAAADLGRADPRRRPHPHRRGRRAAAHPHHRAGRDRAGLGVHPDLRPHRDRAAAHHEPQPGRVGRPRPRPSGPASCRRAGAPALGVAARHRRPGRGPGPRQPRARGLLGAARGHRRGDRRRLVPHRRRRHASTTRATSPSPTARRT